METQALIPWFIVAVLYILGAYAFNVMVRAVDVEMESDKPLSPAIVSIMTVLWPIVMLAVMFRAGKTA